MMMSHEASQLRVLNKDFFFLVVNVLNQGLELSL